MSRICFVEITDEPIIPASSFTERATGLIKPIPAKQKAYLWTGGAYPEANFEIEFPASGPYRPGRYLLGGNSLRVSQRKESKGEIQFNRYGVELVSLEEVAALAKAPPANKIAAVG